MRKKEVLSRSIVVGLMWVIWLGQNGSTLIENFNRKEEFVEDQIFGFTMGCIN